MTARLRFAPEVLVRLGEELNPSPEQGIIELVRNAYDADARQCTVTLADVTHSGGELRVHDDGRGMTSAELEEGWLVLGRSPKDPHARTPAGRLQVGSKGLGRLAALRLGTLAELTTRAKSEPGVGHRIVFDWERFEKADTVDEVALDVVDYETDEPPGTTVVVRHLKRRFSKRDVKRLARALLLLSSPFEGGVSFLPRLDAAEFAELETLVRQGYWDQVSYEIRAVLGADGKGRVELVDHARDGRTWSGEHADLRRAGWRRGDEPHESAPYRAPEARFELHAFNLGPGGPTRSRTSGVTLPGLREWLRVVGGVHLYHRGLRVHPYGDPGHDWLDMNLRRTRSPEERPSTNTSIGRVQVLDEAAMLRQKTDRTGFIETPEFEDLRRFCQDALDWVAGVRLREAEERRQREKRQARQSLAKADESLSRAIASAPAPSRRHLEKARQEFRRATEREVEALAGDLELYRTLATIGTTTAVMAHEAFSLPSGVIRLVRTVRRRSRKLLGDRYNEIQEPVDLIERHAKRLATLVELPRRLLDRGKRRRGTFGINDIVRDTLDILKPLLEEHHVRVDTQLDEGEPRYVGTETAVQSVVANLVINAMNALDASTGSERIVRLQTHALNGTVVLDIADNGPGIRNIDVDQIWLPGRSTTERGVGLGLTIVRDIVADLEGRAEAAARGELGGAQFTIEIPRVADR